MQIRPWRTEDTEEIVRITVETFVGVAIDYYIEQQVGRLGNDWQARKARAVREDIQANPAGVLVAEDDDGSVLGYITTRVDHDSQLGWIPNIGVRPELKSHGIGAQLMQAALAYLRQAGMTHVKIETLEPNQIGARFYPQVGFKEVVRQIHYIMAFPSDDALPSTT
jgi:ribosomal protein S18 acetylase RimI-like enzyme